MATFEYNTDGSYPIWWGYERSFKTEIDDGQFTVPEDHEDFEAIVTRAEDEGHTRVDTDTDDDTDDTNPLEGYTEEDIVNMDGNAVKSLASSFDDLDGRKAADPLREKLIMKLRTE